MKDLIKELEQLKKGYQDLVNDYEETGLENLDSDQIESYGAYLGKLDLCDYLLNKYKK